MYFSEMAAMVKATDLAMDELEDAMVARAVFEDVKSGRRPFHRRLAAIIMSAIPFNE